MPYPHHSMGNSTDAPVRPGTSDALTARTIDATVRPPLVRAQESVATLAPRIAEAAAPFTSPFFLSLLALTLLFFWVAHRMRYRPSALILSVMLVLFLSSFHPTTPVDKAAVASARIPRTRTQIMQPHRWEQNYPQEPVDEQQSPAPPENPGRYDDGQGDPQLYIPRVIIERVPEWTRDAMQNAERAIRENEQMQRLMRELRARIREESRHRRWQRYRERMPADFEQIGYIVTP